MVASLIKSKVSAITKMPAPTTKKDVQSFIGMINYLSKFSARLSEIVEPIRELAKDKVPFSWGPKHQPAFIQMKKEIVSAPILAYYNPKKPAVLQTDISIKGLGACKALTDVQKGYVAIELELLAVVWAMEKMLPFLVCKPFHYGN